MRLIDADALKKHYAWWEDDRQKLFDSIVDSQPTVDAVPLEYISRYQKTCDGDLAMALEDLKASWQIVGPTWKPKR